MRITLAYNLRESEDESQAELLRQEDVDKLREGLDSLGHEVTPAEVTGAPGEIVDALIKSKPDLVFNVAEGTGGVEREAYYPAIYEHLGLPYTGGDPALLLVDLDKRLLEKLLAVRGVRAPRGAFITRENIGKLRELEYPLFIKPNFEGTSKGITQDSFAESPEDAEEYARKLLDEYPAGLNVEQFVGGREFSVPMLELYPGKILEIVESSFEGLEGDKKIFDYEAKQKKKVKQVCPPENLDEETRHEIMDMAARSFQAVNCPDMGRVDIRLDNAGKPYFMEINPLPRLLPDASMFAAAQACGIDFNEMLELIVRSAALRYGLPLVSDRSAAKIEKGRSRPTCRESGFAVGRYNPGKNNAITDVEGIEVGHVTVIKDLKDPESGEATKVRTGVTAVVPRFEDPFNNHLAAGGFVLNGIGEMSGLIQVMEWGWLETPILLTNTMSLGKIHTGIIRYMLKENPELGRKIDVVIPVIGETNDAFLNDVRLEANKEDDAISAIENARPGPVDQGSVGGGTGMISFDFAGGIGTSSRKLPDDEGGYTLGVLVQSNFGKMKNLTIDGAVVGRDLDPLYPYENRRGKTYGSVIVILATDAPLLSVQLDRLAKRASLGLGRVGSFAASTSGEIAFAFSTSNRVTRMAKEKSREMDMSFVSDEHVNPLYEAAVEATHEAVLNAMFCSSGMDGREGRFAPALPLDLVRSSLGRK